MIIIVVSIAIPALLIMVGGEAGRGVESEIRVTATNVAKQLMEEIKSKSWDETPSSPSTTLGPESGETSLSLFDDADDFNNLSGYGNTPCTDTVTVNDVTFTREVDVCYVPAALGDCLGTKTNCTRSDATPTDYKKITVTVTAPATNWGSNVKLVTVMTNY
mgnify:CR=1 FL=1